MNVNKYKFIFYLLCYVLLYSPINAQNSEVTCQYDEPIFISDLGYNNNNTCWLIYVDFHNSSEGITSHRVDEFGELCNSSVDSPVFQSAKFIDFAPGFVVSGQQGMVAEIMSCIPCPIDTPCDDGNACTINDVYTDCDVCEGTIDVLIGAACDDGNACTINDVYTDCDVCEGTSIVGMSCDDGNACTINDLYTDCEVCVGTVEVVIGMACDDGDACTINDVYTNCDVCEGTSKVGMLCNDGDDCTDGDIWTAACQCEGVFQDEDNDTVCNADDICPGGDDEFDVDNDGVPDFCDVCPGGDDGLDADNDDVPDFCDICAGGDDSLDTDNDGIPDACDECPSFDNGLIGQACDDGDDCTVNDVYSPITCQCEGVELDTDNDGLLDCVDPCPGLSDIADYTNLIATQNVTVIPEISGLTYNDETGEMLAVSDNGQWAKRLPSGLGWNGYSFNDFGGNHCNNSEFSDGEAITYMSSSTPTLHRYAIADERDRSIVFVDVANSDLSISHPSSSYLKFSGLLCGNGSDNDGNDGIEGIAYDQSSNTMYFAIEHNDQKIYSFTVPSSITGQTISVQTLIDLENAQLPSSFSTHGLDVMPNGNIVALVTKSGTGDNGAFERMIFEIDPCGDLLGQVDLEPTIANSAELEGIAVVGDFIYVIGEFGKMYQLAKPVPSVPSIQVVSPDPGSYMSGSSVLVNWISSNVTGYARIELHQSGNFITTLTTNTTNDGSHSVTLPFISTAESGYTIKVVSIDDPSVYGFSSSFMIDVPATFTAATSRSSADSNVDGKTVTNNTASVYPNPFFDQLKIELDLTKNERVRIDVFDLQGKLVKDVINIDDASKGLHVFNIESYDLESGLYFIRIQAGGFIQTKKITKL